MDNEQLLLSESLLTAVRAAVNYATEYGQTFIGPSHMLLGLLDDPDIGDMLRDNLERGRVIAASREPVMPGVTEIPEKFLPRGELPPFPRYDTLAFKSLDGSKTMWLSRDAFRVFVEAARRVEKPPFLPKHLALGFVVQSSTDRDILQLLGRDPQEFSTVVYGL